MAGSDLPEVFAGRRYNAYNDWVKRTHGGRVQKVSLDAGFTCPNRDGTRGQGGCSFCNNEGFTPSYLRIQPELMPQIETGIEFMRRRYPESKRFLAYFQAYSNTYGDLQHLKDLYAQALAHPDISGLVIGTRPDCLPDEVLDHLADLARDTLVELEIGIESCSDAVLAECGRGHDFACTRDAVERAAQRGLFITGHMLLGLPGETPGSRADEAVQLARLPLDAVKFHQLQIIHHTRLAVQYRRDPASVPLLDPPAYIDRVVDMLERLSPQVKVQRLGSEIPPRLRASPDWEMRVWDFPQKLEDRLLARETWQGRLYQP